MSGNHYVISLPSEAAGTSARHSTVQAAPRSAIRPPAHNVNNQAWKLRGEVQKVQETREEKIADIECCLASQVGRSHGSLQRCHNAIST